jgi:hypothetical protein
MIAISLIVLTVIAVHDSLTLRAIQSEEDASQTSCERPRIHS